MPPADAPGPIYLSAAALAQRIREKKVSSRDAVIACLARIANVNTQLNAVVQLCAERALMEAKEADGLLAQGRPRGPLHGVTMTIKEGSTTPGSRWALWPAAWRTWS